MHISVYIFYSYIILIKDLDFTEVGIGYLPVTAASHENRLKETGDSRSEGRPWTRTTRRQPAGAGGAVPDMPKRVPVFPEVPLLSCFTLAKLQRAAAAAAAAIPHPAHPICHPRPPEITLRQSHHPPNQCGVSGSGHCHVWFAGIGRVSLARQAARQAVVLSPSPPHPPLPFPSPPLSLLFSPVLRRNKSLIHLSVLVKITAPDCRPFEVFVSFEVCDLSLSSSRGFFFQVMLLAIVLSRILSK
jgi:hypothetical protein